MVFRMRRMWILEMKEKNPTATGRIPLPLDPPATVMV